MQTARQNQLIAAALGLVTILAAGLALGERSAARVLASDLPVGALRAFGIIWVDALVSSDDASTAERTSAEACLVALKR